MGDNRGTRIVETWLLTFPNNANPKEGGGDLSWKFAIGVIISAVFSCFFVFAGDHVHIVLSCE